MLQIFKEIAKAGSGSKYYKVNLHCHTPYSEDWKGPECTPEQYVRAALDAGYDMIAITDHNGIGWCQKIQEAANEILESEGKRIVVLPGVEIYARGGVHILALFEKNTSEGDIGRMLSEMGIHDDQGKGICKKMTSQEYTVDNNKAVEKILNSGGLPIFPHIIEDRGFWKEISGQTRINILNSGKIRILSAPKGKIPDYFSRRNSGLEYQFAFINDSDVHNLSDFTKTDTETWLKMDHCSIEGIKQIVFEPHLNISLDEPPRTHYPRIIGMKVAGGHFEETVFRFNEDLNCIIGGRGAGKSIIIDLLRFAFDLLPRDEDGKIPKRYSERLHDLLKVGNTVHVALKGGDEKDYLITRELNIKPNSSRGGKQFFEILPTQINIVEVRETDSIPVEKKLKEILNPEIFGQGEVLRLTRRAEEQLSLLDNFAEIEPKLKEKDNIIGEMKSVEEQILGCYEILHDLSERLDKIPELEETKQSLEKTLSDEIFVKHNFWKEENNLFRKILEESANLHQKVEKNNSPMPNLPNINLEKTPNRKMVENITSLLESCSEKLQKNHSACLQTTKEAQEKIETIVSAWEKKFEEEENNYKLKLKESGAENCQALSEKLSQVNKDLFNLQEDVAKQYSSKLDETKKLEKKHSKLLDNLRDLQKKISLKRERAAQKITSKMSGGVKVELRKASDFSNFARTIDSLMKQGVRSRESQIDKLCVLTPKRLSKILVEGKKELLIEKTGITPHTAECLLSCFDSIIEDEEIKGKVSKNFFELQRCELIDVPTIYLREEDTFKPLEKLSIGQVCSAILSIALLQKDRPLIIDQPEDELDHSYIMESVVKKLTEMKTKRQFIIATHNQNIPVLGNSEQIFKVRKVPGRENCEIEKSGGFEKMIENILTLEGGKEAFLRRKEKYLIND